MTRSGFLIRNTLLISGAKIVVQACSFLLIPLYTRLLSPADFGVIELVLTYSALLAPALLLQLDAAAFRLLIGTRGDRVRTKSIISSIWAVAFAGILLLLVVIGLTSMVTKQSSIILAGLVFTSAMALSLTQQTARGLGFIRTYVLSSVVSGVSIVAGNLLALLTFDLGPHGVLASTAIGYLLGATAAFFGAQTWKLLNLRMISTREIRNSLRYSLPLVPNGIAWWAIDAGGRAILAVFQGLAAIGTFGIATRITQVFSQVFSYFNLAWVESASLAITDRDKERYFSDVFNQALNVACGSILLMMATLPFYFPIIASNQFSEARALIPILLVSALLNAWVTLYSSVYVALERTRSVLVTTILAGLIAVVLGAATVHQFGAFGIAISSATAWFIALLHRHVKLRPIFRVRYSANTFVSVFLTLIAAVCATTIELHDLTWSPLQWGLLALIFTICMNHRLFFNIFARLAKKVTQP